MIKLYFWFLRLFSSIPSRKEAAHAYYRHQTPKIKQVLHSYGVLLHPIELIAKENEVTIERVRQLIAKGCRRYR